MEQDLQEFKHHLEQQFVLPDHEWHDIKSCVEEIAVQRKTQLLAKSGDLFYIRSGFLVENQTLRRTDSTMVRFFRQKEIFVFPPDIKQSIVVANEDCILFRVRVKKHAVLTSKTPGFHKIWKKTKKAAINKYQERLKFLQGRKYDRHNLFLKEFPGIAKSLSLDQIATYLDVNKSYLSSTKKKK